MPSIQPDLPDWSAGRNVTQDPIIKINQAVNAPTYDSGILDVGAYTFLTLVCESANAAALFHVTITFWADAAGTYQAFADAIYPQPPGAWYSHSYPTIGRYVQIKADERTATGDHLILAIVPSVGPSVPLLLAGQVPISVEGDIAPLASLSTTLLTVQRGVLRIHAGTRALKWTLAVQFQESAAGFSTFYQISEKTGRMPVDTEIFAEPAITKLSLQNNWDFTAHCFLYASFLRVV